MRKRVLKFRIWDVKLKGFISSDYLDRNFGLDFDGNLRCLNSVREFVKKMLEELKWKNLFLVIVVHVD